MENVFVAGYMDGKGWIPCSRGSAIPKEIKCRKAVFIREDTLVINKEQICLQANEVFYARSVQGVKKLLKQAGAAVSPVPEKPTPKYSHAIAYTDGSYNRATGRYGFGVLIVIDEEEKEYSGGAQDTTGGWQVNGEIQAALLAMEEAAKAGCTSLEIRYDYEGVRMWADGYWQAKKNYTAAYRQKVREYRKKMSISFTHIKSHTGVAGNERADALAKKGAGIEEIEVGTDDPPPAGEKISGNPDHSIGEYVNPSCRKAIQKFRRKKNPAFKDFMALKTGGMDYYSKLRKDALTEWAKQRGIRSAGSLPDEKQQLTAIRWMMRGLSEDDAIHKVKVDAEVSENAEKSKKKANFPSITPPMRYRLT